jgi:hypothetical protein
MLALWAFVKELRIDGIINAGKRFAEMMFRDQSANLLNARNFIAEI